MKILLFIIAVVVAAECHSQALPKILDNSTKPKNSAAFTASETPHQKPSSTSESFLQGIKSKKNKRINNDNVGPSIINISVKDFFESKINHYEDSVYSKIRKDSVRIIYLKNKENE